jgi:hypothetical protein
MDIIFCTENWSALPFIGSTISHDSVDFLKITEALDGKSTFIESKSLKLKVLIENCLVCFIFEGFRNKKSDIDKTITNKIILISQRFFIITN